MIPTIGLEIHSILKTKTKMFCGCLNDSEEIKPNVNVCPICLGHPGTLPTINKEAVLKVIKLGFALGGEIPEQSKFDRKSYFYPDLPKGYQISQYDQPLVSGGMLKGIRIRRIHLEEDAGRLLHTSEVRGQVSNVTLVDFNRAGTPLMELVTEPDIKNAEEAVDFAKEFQLILRYLEISDADMEKGQMRVEANVSLSPSGRSPEGRDMGTKVEIKNLNSFKAVYEAIKYEIDRQENLLKKGQKIKHETRGWNDAKKITESQRTKEETHDYRYFPEPDLPILRIGNPKSDLPAEVSAQAGILNSKEIEEIRAGIPELPEAKRARFIREFGLPREKTEELVTERGFADYFEEAASELKARLPEAGYQTLFNYYTSDFKGILNERGVGARATKISPEEFAHLISLIHEGKLSSRLAKNILLKMFETGEDPETIVREEKMELVSGEELGSVAEKVISENPKAVEDYKKGKESAVQFLIGQAMKETKGGADTKTLSEIFKNKLK